MNLTAAGPADPVEVVGRDDDLDLIRTFVEDDGQPGRVLLLTGEPGIGKTALLDAAARCATDRGMRVLRAAGAQGERDIAFSTLHQLLLPIRGEVDDWSSLEAALFRTASGAAEETDDQLALGDATLTLLGHLAGWLGLVVIVDELPWVDPKTATLLAFVTRRLASIRACFIGAARSGKPNPLHGLGFREHGIEPLGEQAAKDLLETRFDSLPAPVRQQVLADARGNPLALLELAMMLHHRAPPPPKLSRYAPLTPRLQAAFGPRLANISD